MILYNILLVLIAILHLVFLWLEMFAWQTWGKKIFGHLMPAELFPKTAILAANQGMYNGLLAAGLMASLFIPIQETRECVQLFFLMFIAIGGIYGSFTASGRIFFIQALPAILAMLVLVLIS